MERENNNWGHSGDSDTGGRLSYDPSRLTVHRLRPVVAFEHAAAAPNAEPVKQMPPILPGSVLMDEGCTRREADLRTLGQYLNRSVVNSIDYIGRGASDGRVLDHAEEHDCPVAITSDKGHGDKENIVFDAVRRAATALRKGDDPADHARVIIIPPKTSENDLSIEEMVRRHSRAIQNFINEPEGPVLFLKRRRDVLVLTYNAMAGHWDKKSEPARLKTLARNLQDLWIQTVHGHAAQEQPRTRKRFFRLPASYDVRGA